MPATFLADECVARLIVDGLIERGLDDVDARLVCRGDDDGRVLALAASSGRVVITEDWGFGEMTVRGGQPATGVIILSLYDLPSGERERVAIERILQCADDAEANLTIIEPGRTRRRPLAGLAER